MTTFCAVCGRGGQTAMVGNALELKHFKPSDHRFVAGPRSQQDETEAPPPSSALTAQVPAVRPAGLPASLLAEPD